MGNLTQHERLDQIGLDAILALIEEGASQREVALKFEVPVSVLNTFIHRDSEQSARVKLAFERSAESWLDRGLIPLEQALSKDSNVDSSAAKAYAQECARRAAIRNKSYRPTPPPDDDSEDNRTYVVKGGLPD